MAAALQFVTTTLRMVSGVLIWATHFGIVYIATALVCARGFQNSSWLGIGIVAWMVAIATVTAIAGISMIIIPAWRSLYRDGPRTATAAFINWMTISFGGLALLAILWVTFPVMLVPIC
ncbi:hypothetical protein [Methylocaldum szegediense]|jgi:hypothetical protein|uniref:Integral membrane protein n=1 Tax=Methylocaldum szegediense TaxID=73780 RepID=A0ABM9HWU1_9GAMM|nr:hypothetical protein [Methylocaldum szegediense]CAI8728543.1 conserved membrane protein of unknown function [Methylocaldum szegediense]